MAILRVADTLSRLVLSELDMFHVIFCLPVTLFHGYPDQGKLRKLHRLVSL